MIVFKIFLDCINFSKKDWNMLHVVWESSHVRNRLNYSIWRQSITYCLHCSSWLNTGSFPDATASCNGVLKTTEDKAEAPPLQFSQVHKPGPPLTYLPLLFCMLGLAPVLSRASAICAMPLITSAECFLGLKEQTRWSGVSTAPTVAAFTWAEWRIRKMEANSSPGRSEGKIQSHEKRSAVMHQLQHLVL